MEVTIFVKLSGTGQPVEIHVGESVRHGVVAFDDSVTGPFPYAEIATYATVEELAKNVQAAAMRVPRRSASYPLVARDEHGSQVFVRLKIVEPDSFAQPPEPPTTPGRPGTIEAAATFLQHLGAFRPRPQRLPAAGFDR